jgi:hypothetical protein
MTTRLETSIKSSVSTLSDLVLDSVVLDKIDEDRIAVGDEIVVEDKIVVEPPALRSLRVQVGDFCTGNQTTNINIPIDVSMPIQATVFAHCDVGVIREAIVYKESKTGLFEFFEPLGFECVGFFNKRLDESSRPPFGFLVIAKPDCIKRVKVTMDTISSSSIRVDDRMKALSLWIDDELFMVTSHNTLFTSSINITRNQCENYIDEIRNMFKIAKSAKVFCGDLNMIRDWQKAMFIEFARNYKYTYGAKSTDLTFEANPWDFCDLLRYKRMNAESHRIFGTAFEDTERILPRGTLDGVASNDVFDIIVPWYDGQGIRTAVYPITQVDENTWKSILHCFSTMKNVYSFDHVLFAFNT